MTINEENLVRDPGFGHQNSIPHFHLKQLKFITTSFYWDHTYQHGYTMLVSTPPGHCWTLPYRITAVCTMNTTYHALFVSGIDRSTIADELSDHNVLTIKTSNV